MISLQITKAATLATIEAIIENISRRFLAARTHSTVRMAHKSLCLTFPKCTVKGILRDSSTIFATKWMELSFLSESSQTEKAGW